MPPVSAKVRVKPAIEPSGTLTQSGNREHCSLDPATAGKVGGLNRQVLVQRDEATYALYTVTSDYKGLAPPPICRMGPQALQRLGRSPSAQFDAVVRVLVTRPGEFIEHLSTNRGNGLAILAPHGGDIEPGTFEEAQRLEALLPGKPVRRWACEGQKRPATKRARRLSAGTSPPRTYPSTRSPNWGSCSGHTISTRCPFMAGEKWASVSAGAKTRS